MSWVTYNCPHCGKEFKISVNDNAGASTVHAVCSNCHKIIVILKSMEE